MKTMALGGMRGLCAMYAGLLSAAPVFAEAPMNTDDAGTLDKGAMKLEGVWSRDDRERGGELLFGFSPVEKLEMEIVVSRARDGSANPDTALHGAGFGVKWVPYQNDTGWALGARFDHGSTRVTDDATPARFTEKEYALTGLASYRRENGQVLHRNLGTLQTTAQGARDTVGAWSIGYKFPLVEKLRLTAETFGVKHARPDMAVGLRQEVFDGITNRIGADACPASAN